MKTSEQINELAKALAAAQLEIKNATLNKVNPHFKSRYADLAEIRNVIPVLAKHGIATLQGTDVGTSTNGTDVIVCMTRLVHRSGQWVESIYPLPFATDKPQQLGSAYTYARRYSLAAICGIAAEEDDDADAAQKHSTNGNGKAAVTPKFAAHNGPPLVIERKPYEELQAALRINSNLTDLTQWWESPATNASVRKQPVKWRWLLFAEFITHGFEVAESNGARRKFFEAYEEAIQQMPDDEPETRKGVINKYHEFQETTGNGAEIFDPLGAG
jgi:hypothetical protein